MHAERILSLLGPNVWSNEPVLEVWLQTDNECEFDARSHSATHSRLARERSSFVASTDSPQDRKSVV